MMDIVKLLREAGDVYHDIARDMLQNEWKEHLAPHYTQRGDELKLAAAELEGDAVPEFTESHLNAVRSVLDQAYNSAVPVCCGRAGQECCGSPEPSWTDDNIAIMDALGPVEKFLSEMLAAAPGAGGAE